ncbi:Bone morphogenetic protein 4 [Orchesella cincta]|uniref:Bone morphogenetic protein 4 n=1 Tax=Orchesella cincta TaxID=48709 RepID=A0A1D2MTN2_ORCCI|nr:Bone morphogenetic protein 4 [Orchesella cincta]
MELVYISKFVLIFSVLFNLSTSESDSNSSSSSSSSESNEIIARLEIMSIAELDQENSVSGEKRSSSHHYSMEKQSKRSRPSKYMNMLLKQIVSSNPSSHPPNGNGGTVSLKIQDRIFEKPRDRLFYAWMPTETKETSSGRSTVLFQQILPRDNFGNFTASQIVLTLQDNAELDVDATTQISMFTHWENEVLEQELMQTQSITREKKFYTFDVKEYIESRLKHNLTHSNFVRISFQVTVRHARSRMVDFEKLFDVHVDRPFIIFFYHDFLPMEITSTDKRSSRKSRSIPDRSSSQCQRRSFEVLPEEVHWMNVVSPEKLDLGYCSGGCPTPLQDQRYNITLHSFLLDRYRMQAMFNVPSDFPHSGCIPVTYKSISVLEQIGPDEFEASIVHDISVASCGCRY